MSLWTGQRCFGLSSSLCTILLVGCAPSWRSSVVQIVVVVAATATACAVFFVAIVNPVAGPISALVQCTSTSINLTRQCRISRRVCSISPEVGVSSCSSSYPSFGSAAAGRYRRLEWHGVMRRSWRMSRANVDGTVQGGGSCGTCCLSVIASSMRLYPAMSPTFLTPSLGPSSLSLSLRGPRGGGGARLSGLRPAPPPLPPPRC